MFESPLEWCSLCRNWVALDQSFEEHVRECGCGCSRDACPLAALFRPLVEPRPAPVRVVPAPSVITAETARPATRR